MWNQRKPGGVTAAHAHIGLWLMLGALLGAVLGALAAGADDPHDDYIDSTNLDDRAADAAHRLRYAKSPLAEPPVSES